MGFKNDKPGCRTSRRSAFDENPNAVPRLILRTEWTLPNPVLPPSASKRQTILTQLKLAAACNLTWLGVSKPEKSIIDGSLDDSASRGVRVVSVHARALYAQIDSTIRR
jgi:hypothetical protein